MVQVSPAITIPAIFEAACKKAGSQVALRVERGPIIKPLAKGEKPPPAMPADQWTTWTYDQYYAECVKAAKSLIATGVQPHDAVNIYGFNAPEWLMGEVSAILVGAMAAGIYPTDTTAQVTFKAKHSGAAIAFVGDEAKFTRMKEAAENLPKMKAIVAWDCDHMCGEDFTTADGRTVKVYSWEKFLEVGADVSDAALNERIAAQKPGNCCAIIYTSGTTGDPKGVMISHDNIIFDAKVVMNLVPHIGQDAANPERILSYLPLSHVAGMMVDIIMPMYCTATLPATMNVSFARVYDLKAGSLKDRLQSVKPTLFLGVPRVWEKIAEKMKAIGASITGVKKKISTWAKAKGLEHQRACQLGGTGEYPPFYGVAEAIVLGNVKKALGLEHCKFGFTGAAPISTDTLEYFGQLGIQINEVYGMSENCGATTFSTDNCHVWGSCGFEIPGLEVKVMDAEKKTATECAVVKNLFDAPEAAQGEICFRGRHIMMGYMANPELGSEHVKTIEKKLAEAIDKDGWLHSGDKGCKDDKGFLKITGRYKELLIGAGGENIAPVPMEDEIKRIHPAVSNVMMVGDKRKFNVALVTLKAVGATGDQPGTDELDGGAVGITDATTISGACKDKAFTDSIIKAVTDTNNNPVCCPMNAAKIQKFTILPYDFSVEGGELTPTLKTKRSVVCKKFDAAIEAMYKSKEAYVPFVAN